jgi:hypothetical protein
MTNELEDSTANDLVPTEEAIEDAHRAQHAKTEHGGSEGDPDPMTNKNTDFRA